MTVKNALASAKIGKDAVVYVTGIHYDEPLRCDRKCDMLEEDGDGILVCGEGRVENIARFQTRALTVDFHCVLSLFAKEKWILWRHDFKVIDEDGFIHEGDFLCEKIPYPVRTVESGHTLYRGTRANVVIRFPDFPEGQKIRSIVVQKDLQETIIDLEGGPAVEPEVFSENMEEEEPASELLERIEALEEAVRELQQKYDMLEEDETDNREQSQSQNPRGRDHYSR